MNQEDSEQNEVDGMKKGADFTGKVMQHMQERLVICNEEDKGWSSYRDTTDAERVLLLHVEIQPRSNDGTSDALCNITRQRTPKMSQGLDMKNIQFWKQEQKCV